MTVPMTEHTIDLSSLDYRDFSDQEKQGFAKVRSGFAEQLLPILEQLVKQSDTLGKTNIDYQNMLKAIKEILELQKAAAWLNQKCEQIEETYRFKLSELKPGADKIVEVARPLSTVNEDVGNLFAALFDFIAEPRKKAESTKKKNQKSEEQKESSSDSSVESASSDTSS